ncbi:MAG: alpha-ketoacid dehydrogenase subunit beta [Phycisphaeraceae bacterium]|nr:alpha-ketoacid dehydrogenase subunit beta [Phycisphaerales bacterium]QOJ18201.1 MAG: alpha-ketoacid dehydrogenase subunit beta [Phycisphaeraceae bacterium]
MPQLTMVEALNLALDEAMRDDDRVVLMGEDIAVNGGVFRVTRGLMEKYGRSRVMDTPLAENGIIGTAVGMAVYGLKPVAEIQFSGFTLQAFDQIEQNMARLHNRSRGKYPIRMVMRCPYGGGIRAVEHHSESREAYWAHTPGLKMVIPSTPRNARALLHAAIQDDDPVVFYEPKAVYRAFREEVPVGEPTAAKETFPIGKAHVVREGADITLIAYGAMMRPVLEATEDLVDEHGINPEVIDLLSIRPMDTEALCESVAKTGRCVIVHEGPRTCGVAAEIIARLNEHVFDMLQAPVKRITGYDIHFPYFQCEKHYLPDSDTIVAGVMETVGWG